MAEKTMHTDFQQLYIVCENFLCNDLLIESTDFRRIIRKYLATDGLKEVFNQLPSHSNLDKPLPLLTEKEFFHRIDHYDGYIHDQKRDKTGSYYTPIPIVDYMLEGLLNTPTLSEKIRAKKPFLLLEPACGTMVFPRRLLLKLYEITKDKTYCKEIMDRLIVVDLQPEPLLIGCLGLLYTYYSLFKEIDLSFKVRCGDSLTMVDLYNTMDLVFGNPPYLGEKGNGAFFRVLKENPAMTPYYTGRMDLYYFFIHYGLNTLKTNGIMSFITTNYFATADSGKLLRHHLKKAGIFNQITNYSGNGFFKSARGQHNVSFIFKKTENKGDEICQLYEIERPKKGELFEIDRHTIEASKLYDDQGLIGLSIDSETYLLLEKIKNQCDGILSDVFDVKQGIVSGADFVTKRMLEKDEENQSPLEKGDPIYVFPKTVEQPFEGPWRDFYKNSDIDSYRVVKNPRYKIYYVDAAHPPTEEGLRHLERFKFVLEKRREVERGYRRWYELQWPRSEALFNQPKLIMPQRHLRNVFAYTDKAFFGSADIYYIIHERQDVDSLLYLNGVINSKMYYYWLFYRGKRKGEMLELYSTPIKNLPLLHYKALSWQKQIVQGVKDIINKNMPYEKNIDAILYKGFSLSDVEIEKIETLYDGK